MATPLPTDPVVRGAHATSRTRATADTPLIDYRPLPASFGDREGLRAVRAAKSRAARRGEDPSTLQLPAPRTTAALPPDH